MTEACEFRTLKERVPLVLAGNRGSCEPNFQNVPSKCPVKRHSRHRVKGYLMGSHCCCCKAPRHLAYERPWRPVASIGQIPHYGCGCSSGVEHDLAKVGVEGSNPFARSKFSADPFGSCENSWVRRKFATRPKITRKKCRAIHGGRLAVIQTITRAIGYQAQPRLTRSAAHWPVPRARRHPRRPLQRRKASHW